MSGPRVVNTRPRDQASGLSSALRTAGYEPLEMPAIDIVPAWDAAELESVAANLRRQAYGWLVLSSANAGRFLSAGLAAHALRFAETAGLSILAGEATARALGLSPTLALRRFSANAALEALRPRLGSGDRVLIPRAAEGREELADGLIALGVSVDAPTCYRTVPSADLSALRALRADVLTLCSPSAATACAAWLPTDALVVCLGDTTANAARALGVPVATVADETSMASLVSAVGTALALDGEARN